MGDGVDHGVAIVFGVAGKFAEVSGRALRIELANEDFGVAGRLEETLAASRPRWGMNRKCGLVQVALELEAGLPDELLVIGIVGDGRSFAEDVLQPHQPQVDEEDGVGLGQQPSRFRPPAASQIHDSRKGGRDQ